MNPCSLYDLSFPELVSHLSESGLSNQAARDLWQILYHPKGVKGRLASISPALRRWIKEHLGEGKTFEVDSPELVDEIHSEDGQTRKFLLRLQDGQVIETVLMGYRNRHTVCVSSQAGCAMGCVFCATGQMGFSRHLRCGEIVAHVLHARKVLHRYAPEARLRNLVMMGMGEPLHNIDAVLKALGIISDARGIGIGPSKITISTVGVVPGIERLTTERLPYGLAVSLHGSCEQERAALVPVSKRWPLDRLIEACRSYTGETGKRIFFEWTLIAGQNDSPDTALRLASLLKGIDAHVNLIPLNPTRGYTGTSSHTDAGRDFQAILREQGIPCTFRQFRGIDVAAGCGMLKGANV
ncbi:MAG: 23S rRNA (adenine(2503)-C(2))-methyltransferase RlmN [Kiritimatiellae bacterium]|jgi:23S rRNA (adenine2503-C2)-methyltransferase|nr:23S rRNA (adenine(2503)-C(2))-methyltransferase RlmN [Kiritimatiellia bacterium]